MHVEELTQDPPQHLHQLQQHPHPQPDADLPNGPLTNGVMMKTTMLTAIGMEAPAVTMALVIGITIAQVYKIKCLG